MVPREGTLQAETSVDPEISIDHKTYRHTEIGWLINREILVEGRPLDEHTIDRHEKWKIMNMLFCFQLWFDIRRRHTSLPLWLRRDMLGVVVRFSLGPLHWLLFCLPRPWGPVPCQKDPEAPSMKPPWMKVGWAWYESESASRLPILHISIQINIYTIHSPLSILLNNVSVWLAAASNPS